MPGGLDVPFAYAFTLGMVATVNPCGFPMLPAYLSFFIGADDDRAGAGRLPRALLAAGAVSLGFLTVFSVLAVPLDAGVSTIYRIMPWLTIAVGCGLVGLGVAMLLGHKPTLALPRLDRGGRDRRFGSMVLFGISYAIASLSCTIPLFLGVVANRAGPAASAVTVVAYGLGMSTVLVVLTVALALARESLVRRVRTVLPHVHRASGGLLVAVGLYLVYYWVFNLSRDPAATIGDNPFSGLESARVAISAVLERHGRGLAALAAAAVAAGGAWALLRRGGRRGPAAAPHDDLAVR